MSSYQKNWRIVVKYGLKFSKTDKGGNHRNAFHNACSKCSIKALVVATDNYPAYIYLLKVNNGNARTICGIYSKLK